MAWDSSMTVLMIWLVSDVCTLMLVGARAKRWWRLLLSMKPLYMHTCTHAHTHNTLHLLYIYYCTLRTLLS